MLQDAAIIPLLGAEKSGIKQSEEHYGLRYTTSKTMCTLKKTQTIKITNHNPEKKKA